MLENAIVVGTFSFVGFHLSKNLLEDGLTVFGIDIQNHQESEELIEEKRMDIGRNSNFHYFKQQDIENWQSEISLGVDTIFFSIDLSYNQEDITFVEKYLYETIEYCKCHSIKLIYLSTTEIVSHGEDEVNEESKISPVTKRGELYSRLESIIKEENSKQNFRYIVLRLPTLYGPWQPESFAYQQILRLIETGKQGTWVMDEYIGDVLYIDDAVVAIKNAAISNITEDVIHVTTGNVGEWIKGMEYLLDTQSGEREINYFLSNKKAKSLLAFTPMVSIEEGLTKQQSHLRSRLANDIQ